MSGLGLEQLLTRACLLATVQRRAEAEAHGLRASLESARRRHLDQLARERADFAGQLRAAKEENLRLLTTAAGEGGVADDAAASVYLGAVGGSAALEQQLTAIVELVRGRGAQEDQADPAASLEDIHWRVRVLERFKGALIECERLRAKAEADARISAHEGAVYLSRLAEAEAALERAMAGWESAEGIRAAEAGNYIRSIELRAQHGEERLVLKQHHVDALAEALERTSRQLIDSEAGLKQAREVAEQERARVETLARRVRLLEADLREAEARVAAIIMEHSGTQEVDPSGSVTESVARRDLAIKRYFETEALRLLLATDPKDKLLGLTRELCGIKVVESQLLASLAAARKRADALAHQAAALRESNKHLEGKLQSVRDGGSPARAGPAEDGTAAALAAQLSARQLESFRLQDEILTLQQRLQTRELKCDELERERARSEEVSARMRHEAESALNRLRCEPRAFLGNWFGRLAPRSRQNRARVMACVPFPHRREELTTAHNAQLAALTQDLDQSRQRHMDAVRSLRAELVQAREHALKARTPRPLYQSAAPPVRSFPPPDFGADSAFRWQERDAAVATATEGRPSQQVYAALGEQKDMLDELARRLQEENEALLSDLKKMERENLELRDDRETRGRAIEASRGVSRHGRTISSGPVGCPSVCPLVSALILGPCAHFQRQELERTLASIERAADRAASTTVGRTALFGSKRGGPAVKGSGGQR